MSVTTSMLVSCTTREARAWSASAPPGRRGSAWATAALMVGSIAVMALFVSTAQASSVPLGTAANFAVLAGSTITNAGPSVISGNVGVSPGSAVTGFGPGSVIPPSTIYRGGPIALQAKNDLTTAYNNVAGRSSNEAIFADLAGRTLAPGVYTSASSLALNGTLTLDAKGDPDAEFVFQAGSTLLVGTTTVSRVRLINGAQASNVFWQVGSSATIGVGSAFAGNILALTSITMDTNATLNGRALAQNGAVTLDSITVTAPATAPPPPPPPPPGGSGNGYCAAANPGGPALRRGVVPLRGSLAHGGIQATPKGAFFLDTPAGPLEVTPVRRSPRSAPIRALPQKAGITTRIHSASAPLSTTWRLALKGDDESFIKLGRGGVGVVAHRVPACGRAPQIGPNKYLVATASGPLATDTHGNSLPSSLKISGSRVSLVTSHHLSRTARVLWSPVGALPGGWWGYGVDRALPNASFSFEQGRPQTDGRCSYQKQSQMDSNTQGAEQQVAELSTSCRSLVYKNDTTLSPDQTSSHAHNEALTPKPPGDGTTQSSAAKPLAEAVPGATSAHKSRLAARATRPYRHNVGSYKAIYEDPIDLDVSWVRAKTDWYWGNGCVRNPVRNSGGYHWLDDTGWEVRDAPENVGSSRCSHSVSHQTNANFRNRYFCTVATGGGQTYEPTYTVFKYTIVAGQANGTMHQSTEHHKSGPCSDLLHYSRIRINEYK